jgi:hypothetical protein
MLAKMSYGGRLKNLTAIASVINEEKVERATWKELAAECT